MGAARQPDQLRRGRRSLRAGHRPLTAPPRRRATAGRRRRFRRQASPWTSHHRATFGRRSSDLRAALVGPSGGARRPSGPGGPRTGGSAVPSPRSDPLPAWRVLARSCVHPADLGAARHGRYAARRRLRVLRRPLGAALPGPWRRGHGRPAPPARLGGSGPPLWPGPPTLSDFQIGLWTSLWFVTA